MAYAAITLQIQDRIARIVLNRPDSGNILDLTMSQEIIDACALIQQDEDIRVVTLTANGRDFCRGNSFEQPGAKRKPAPGDILPVAAAIAALEVPIVCGIQGSTRGQGLELALACDVRIATKNARLGFPNVALGFLPADGGTQRLPRLVGKAPALEMLFTGETLTAAGAREIGLIGAVVAKEALNKEIEAMTQAMAQKAPYAFRYIKEAINKGLDLTLDQGLRLEADLYFLLHTTRDRVEGIRAFQQKRTPRFEGK